MDQLLEYILKINSDSKVEASREKDMEALTQFFLGIHKEQRVEYTAKYRNIQDETEEQPPTVEVDEAIIPEPQPVEAHKFYAQSVAKL